VEKKAVFTTLPMSSLNKRVESMRTPRFQTVVKGIIKSSSILHTTDLELTSVLPKLNLK